MKIAEKFVVLMLICVTLFSCVNLPINYQSVAYAQSETFEGDDAQKYVSEHKAMSGVESYNKGSNESDVATQRHIDTYKDRNPFEIAISQLLLAVGDMFVNLMNSIIGPDVTPTRLVYNNVGMVDPNFFGKNAHGTIAGSDIKRIIGDIYMFLNGIAITLYVIAVLAIGIYALIYSTSAGLSKAKQLSILWLKGVLLLCFGTLFMRLILFANELLVDMLRTESTGISVKTGVSFVPEAGEWSVEEIEFRSPEFVSKYTGKASYGSEEASNYYVKRLANYETNFDLMRIMRAYAGVTMKLVYVFIWYVLIGQFIVFFFIYLKRYFIVCFLIAIFPLTCIFYSISLMKGGKPGEVSAWFREFCSNVFMQFVHAVIYTIITGLCVGLVQDNMASSSAMNWILIIVSINFVPEGEKIVRKMIKAVSSGSNDIGGAAGTIRGITNKATDYGGNLLKGTLPKEFQEKDDE